jgi:hypothetical protein
MLVARDGSSNPHQCFDPIFTGLQPILKEQLEALQEEVRRFKKLAGLAPYASEGMQRRGQRRGGGCCGL